MNRPIKVLDGRNFLYRFGGISLKNAVKKIPVGYFDDSLDFLEQLANPSQTDKVLKSQFWNLTYERLPTRKKIKLSQIYQDVCTYQWFYHGFLKNPEKVAWMLRIEFKSSSEFEITHQLVLHEINRALRAYWGVPVDKWPAHHFRFMLKAVEFFADYFHVGVTNTRS